MGHDLVGTQESLANAEVQQGVQRYLHGINTAFHPVIISPEQILPLPDWKASLPHLQGARERLANMHLQAQKACQEYSQD